MSITILKDLRPMLGPARDQAPRPTCMAFAASDAHAALRDGWEPLSAEWAYYHALKRDGAKPTGGTTLSAMRETLRSDGQPPEADWPYVARDIDTSSNWAPPATTSALFRRDSDSCPATLASICAKLDDGRPLLVIMTVSAAFDYGWDSDFVVDADEPLVPKRRHAVVAVGHGTREADQLLLIRNSWGVDWGDGGHAWISERYLKPRLAQAALLTEEH
jgi:hypothetical protein